MLCIELQLGLALPGHDGDHRRYSRVICESENKKKGGFDDAFGGKSGDSLLVWYGQPSDDGHDDNTHSPNTSCPINTETDKENNIIGWPPIKTSRKKDFLHHHHGGRQIKKRPTARIRVNPASSYSSSSSSSTAKFSTVSTYVKVKMEGFAIARKVDLSLHRSYHSLKHCLIAMFSNYGRELCGKNIEDYTLAYQDKEGDWLLAGDVPWKSFVKSVQRLEVVTKK